MKKEVSFIFPYYDAIRSFLQEIHTNNCSVIPSKNILRCNCTETETELAKRKYHAVVLDQGASGEANN